MTGLPGKAVPLGETAGQLPFRTPSLRGTILIQIFLSTTLTSFDHERVMPVPDHHATRQLPNDFVWGYATGEQRERD